MRDPLRVGLVGAGMVSAYHLPAWRALGDRVHDSLDALLRHETLDAVDLMTPPALHAAQCRAAADAGVAVLCQKPLAPTWAEASSVVQTSAGACFG